MQRLQLINFPHRRELVVWPHRTEPASPPGVDFRPLTPEEQRARRDAVNARKPKAVRINFNCGCRQIACIGHADVTDDRVARFLINGGYCRALDPPGQGSEDELRREAEAFQRKRHGPYRRRA
jgi:hypothetical protein